MEFSEFATQKLLQATGQSEHLTDREKHLIGLAVTATRGCIACTGGRLKRALESGDLLRDTRSRNRFGGRGKRGRDCRDRHAGRGTQRHSQTRACMC